MVHGAFGAQAAAQVRAGLVLGVGLADHVGAVRLAVHDLFDLGVDVGVGDVDAGLVGDGLEGEAALECADRFLLDLAAHAGQDLVDARRAVGAQAPEEAVEFVIHHAVDQRARQLDGVAGKHRVDRRAAAHRAGHPLGLATGLGLDVGAQRGQIGKAQVLGELVVDRRVLHASNFVNVGVHADAGTGLDGLRQLFGRHHLVQMIPCLGTLQHQLECRRSVLLAQLEATAFRLHRRRLGGLVAFLTGNAERLDLKVDQNLIARLSARLDRHPLATLQPTTLQRLVHIDGVRGHDLHGQLRAVKARQIELWQHLDREFHRQVRVLLELCDRLDLGATHGLDVRGGQRLHQVVTDQLVEDVAAHVGAVHALDHRRGGLAGTETGDARLSGDPLQRHGERVVHLACRDDETDAATGGTDLLDLDVHHVSGKRVAETWAGRRRGRQGQGAVRSGGGRARARPDGARRGTRTPKP